MSKNNVIFVVFVILVSFDSFQCHLVRRRRDDDEEITCTLPNFPKHGSWNLIPKTNNKPGDVILGSSVIKFHCNHGYRLSSNALLLCDENWPTEFPECEKKCPPLYSSDIFKLKCYHKVGKEVKCTEATHGSHLEYECAPFYETPFGLRKSLFCEDGKWSSAKPICQPVCGKKIIENSQLLIYGSKPNEKLEYPWVVVLYQKIDGEYNPVCGGSILSETVILTAAHCVTNDFGDSLSRDVYAIGAGKLHAAYEAPEDKKYAQYLTISKIIVHGGYKANSRRYLADIAVLVTNGELVMNEVVQPVCFNGLNRIHLRSGHVGEVSGWGRAEGDELSEVLRTLKIPYKYETVCAAELPRDFNDKFNTVDKICAGFVDRNTSVCDGDSGSGLAFQNSDDNRYYIHGVVSLGPKSKERCDIQQNTLYTKVAYYYSFVEQLVTKYAREVKDCVLPSYPKNGKWTIQNQNKKPGNSVGSSTILKFECNPGYKLSSPFSEIECSSAYNLPTCQILCPPLTFPPETFYQCTKNKQVIDCLEALDGTKLVFSCPKGYVNVDGKNRYCTRGIWGPSQPKCVRPVKECGKPYKTSNLELYNTTEEVGLDFPWNALIYNGQKDEEHQVVCTATVLTKKILITSATCVTNEDGSVKSPEDLIAVAGKMRIGFNDSNDIGAQYVNVTNIIVHPDFLPIADIALLLVQKGFRFNSFVQPICLSDGNEPMFKTSDVGLVTAWKPNEKLNTYTLTHVEVFNKNSSNCKADDTAVFAEIIAIDKYCLGPKDNEGGICSENVGTNFITKSQDDGRYYLQGTYSGNFLYCPQDSYYTNVTFYYEFLECIITKF